MDNSDNPQVYPTISSITPRRLQIVDRSCLDDYIKNIPLPISTEDAVDLYIAMRYYKICRTHQTYCDVDYCECDLNSTDKVWTSYDSLLALTIDEIFGSLIGITLVSMPTEYYRIIKGWADDYTKSELSNDTKTNG